jgi:hypothetical protein
MRTYRSHVDGASGHVGEILGVWIRDVLRGGERQRENTGGPAEWLLFGSSPRAEGKDSNPLLLMRYFERAKVGFGPTFLREP